ncbi:MAG: succinate dehydrogenase [Zetaproteobacteria bacterium CG12_big_fil_rev_8_21_14_0_65_54_13]|nr:MAG: succinate dehydrogenase [Zetaproteobacteria bacterium CG12_big_fil_rev_8_21_14_0_65_54_13]PIX54880.1 MAG: succinate dehydrogenase [Zetaproteobacteria bacterium CG_4_10_14_3_um_filter_54_28]PJA30347.1 MAG: succinate dehydrogenase [Zetaproteobacteria bacterium CG_4_9_14_3_um_filter_54_145]
MAYMRLIAVTLLLLLVACVQVGESVTTPQKANLSGQEEHPNYLQSKLVFEPDHVTMAPVLEGDKAVAFLRVRNAGEQMENIVSVTTSCGCSVAEPAQNLLMPGGFTQVKITVDTFAKQDDVRKWVELTDGQGRRSRAWLSLDVKANPHMATTSRTIFDGQCGSCHFAPAAGKQTGPAIYRAVCVMCHGEKGQGAYAPKLTGHKNSSLLAGLISAGTGSQHMPGFAREQGGPLTPDQVAALSQWLSTLDE